MTPPNPPPSSLWPWHSWDAHYRVAAAAVAALITALLLRGHSSATSVVLACWDVFAAVNLALIWAVILHQDPYAMRQAVRLEDASRTFLFTMVVAAAAASLFAVILTLRASKGTPSGHLATHLLLSVAAVVLAWTLVHTVFAMRYAHYYYESTGGKDAGAIRGGLQFPNEPKPDYLDFAYFAFVVGMTCQVSDVQIERRSLRRMALWHGLIAFGFNTAILALFVNIVAGLL